MNDSTRAALSLTGDERCRSSVATRRPPRHNCATSTPNARLGAVVRRTVAKSLRITCLRRPDHYANLLSQLAQWSRWRGQALGEPRLDSGRFLAGRITSLSPSAVPDRPVSPRFPPGQRSHAPPLACRAGRRVDSTALRGITKPPEIFSPSWHGSCVEVSQVTPKQRLRGHEPVHEPSSGSKGH
jgi:hypothetical protein